MNYSVTIGTNYFTLLYLVLELGKADLTSHCGNSKRLALLIFMMKIKNDGVFYTTP